MTDVDHQFIYLIIDDWPYEVAGFNVNTGISSGGSLFLDFQEMENYLQ